MTVVINGDTGISGVDGTAGTPALQGNDTNTGIFFPAADTIAFAEGGTEVARFDSSGNFGIGTSSPTTKLHVVGNVTVNDGQQYCFGSNNYNGMAGSAASNIVQFYTNNAERARIDSSGNLLVAKTSTSASSGIGYQVISSGETNAVMSASTNATTTNSIYSTGASAYRFYVGLAGTLFATSTTISAISDQRLKENVQDLDVGLDAVMALKPRKFDWKEGKGKDIKGDRGWIAQEFEQVFPDMVSTWMDQPPEGEEPYKSVGADLIPVLVKALQEQQQMIETLQAKVAALEAR